MTEIAWALKEWAIAVEALLAGELVLLIRKGGIREAKPVFQVSSDRALLFPTYEHQQPAALRPPWRAHVETKSVPQVGDPVLLPGWAEITHQWPLVGSNLVEALHPFHIWTDEWLTERLAWKPERPAYALLLRVHRFAQPLNQLYQKSFGGCRSWIELDPSSPLPESVPVLASDQYDTQVTRIQQVLAAACLQ